MTGLDGVTGCYESGGGFVRPERCIEIQLERARQSGARLVVGKAVTAIEQDASGVTVRAGEQAWRADRAVVTAGSWNLKLVGSPFDRLLKANRQVLHWFGLGERPCYADGDPVFIRMHGGVEDRYFYGFPPIPGERPVKVATEQFTESTDPDRVRRDADATEAAEMYGQHLDGRMAGLSGTVLESSVCLYTTTPDHHFIVDRHPDMDRVTVVSACSGHGFKHSAGLGEALARGLARETVDVDMSPFALRRFVA